jgi:hypothetical protein
MAILEDTGIINSILDAIGIGPIHMINTSGAVILGMVYNYLPYMIIPLHSVMSKIDIRLLDFNDTTIKEGSMSANFMTYFYLRTDKAPGDLIWFGLNFFNGLRVDGGTSCGWSPDSGAHQYMYKIPQSMVFGGVENSFVPRSGVVNVGEEWKHVRIDVTPHIEQAVEWANRDNAFGVPVTVEDMYFEGANIGFETWGNYDYTVEFKNFNMIAYNKD